MLVSCFAYTSTLRMKAICFFKTLVEVQQTRRHYNTADRILFRLVSDFLKPDVALRGSANIFKHVINVNMISTFTD
jgi:hypothetical protein